MESTIAVPPTRSAWRPSPTQVSVALPVLAVLTASAVFAVFVAFFGRNPAEVFALILQGGFGSSFAWQDTLSRAAPLILVGLAVEIPAQAGLVIIGGEGALVIGGLAAAIITLPFADAMPLVMQLAMLLAGALIGAAWFSIVGALRQYRGLNEVISSLLLSYIAIAVFHHLTEGPLRDTASLDKPSTHPINTQYMLPVVGADRKLSQF